MVNRFSVIDTGGIEIDGEDAILKSIRMQAELAIEEADVIVFMCDAKSRYYTSRMRKLRKCCSVQVSRLF